MSREVHVRFCGGLEVRFLRSTRLLSGFLSDVGCDKGRLVRHVRAVGYIPMNRAELCER